MRSQSAGFQPAWQTGVVALLFGCKDGPGGQASFYDTLLSAMPPPLETSRLADRLAAAVRYHRAGALDAAERLYRAILAEQPRQPDAWHLLGLILCQRGEAEAGIAFIRQALALAPALPDACYNLALALEQAGSGAEAEAAYRSACAQAPTDPRPWHRLAFLLKDQGRLGPAIACLQDALRQQPDQSQLLDGLGVCLQADGDPAAAVAAHRHAVAGRPGEAPLYVNLGNALAATGRLDAAETAYRRGLLLDPAFAPAHANLAILLRDRGHAAPAIAHFERALGLGFGDDGSLLASLVQLCLRACDWVRADRWSQVLREHLRRGDADGVPPFLWLQISDDPAEQQAAARRYARGVQASPSPPASASPPARATRTDGRLRLGYLSADFHQHPTTELLVEVLEHHDRRGFETFAYSTGAEDGSPLRRRLVASVDRFIELHGAEQGAIAARIRADALDILIDLKGYTTNARPGVMARRPAPVQMQFLGYPGTLGAPWIDYVLVDAVLMPPTLDPFFDEKPIRLPDSYQPNDRHRALEAPDRTPSRTALGLPADAFVFCCFNNTSKITRARFALWLEILKDIPDGVLWLLETVPLARSNLERAVAEAGLAPERLRFAARRPAAAYRGLFRRADLFLDTGPYGAHTTASDALWAGLPVLTCPGRSAASRVAASLLSATGLSDLIAPTLADYAALARACAGRPAWLTRLRLHLISERERLPLFDTPRFVAHLEAAYRLAWQRHRSGQPPAAIDAEAVRQAAGAGAGALSQAR